MRTDSTSTSGQLRTHARIRKKPGSISQIQDNYKQLKILSQLVIRCILVQPKTEMTLLNASKTKVSALTLPRLAFSASIPV